MRHLELYRVWKTDLSTIGILSVENKFYCFSLEDKVREPFIKVPKETAIPPGTYKLKFKVSPRTKLMTPWIQDVPQFKDTQLHIANRPNQVEGCIGVGLRRGKDCVLDSRLAFTTLMKGIDILDDWDIHVF